MNNIKLFAIEGGFILDNAGSLFQITNEGVIKTTANTSSLEEVSFDIEVQAMLDNAANTIQELQEIVQSEIENFD